MPPETRPLVRLPTGMKLVNTLLGGWTALMLLFLYLPILVLIAYSFNRADVGTRWTGFTLHWYRELFEKDDLDLLTPMRNSLIIAAIVTVASTILGTVGAWLMHQYTYRFAPALRVLIYTPMIVPEVIMGISFLIFFKSIGIDNGMTRVILAHITFCFPFVLVAVQARLVGLDPAMQEAAMDLGATPLKAFLLVIVPYLMPAIIAGALMSFTLSMDELVVTWFTYDFNSATLPVRVFELARKGPKTDLNVISAIFIFGTILLVVLLELSRRWRRA
jgi:spermidine/putrescine transport system permease protein